MANASNEEIVKRLSAIERDMRELLTLVKQMNGGGGQGGADDVSEDRFFDAEGGE